MRVEHFSYPTRTRTRPVPKIATDPTRPDPTRPAGIPVPVANLPVGLGLPLLGIIGLVAYPGQDHYHCISSDESIFCSEDHGMHAPSS